jgi:Curli production assembly/transport component CsgG.
MQVVKPPKSLVTMLLVLCFTCPIAFAQEGAKEKTDSVYPVAVLPFVERQKKNDETGKVVSDILFATLATDPSILLVDREDLDKVLEEQGINISGVVDSNRAVKVGHIIGAKILVTGSVLKAGSTQYLVAKVIGTETTRVIGTSVKGNENADLSQLAEELAQEVGKLILEQGDKLVAHPETRENRIARLKNALDGKTLPRIMVDIPESHVGQRTIDPAAETEFNLMAKEIGFTVFEKQNAGNKADIIIKGEAFSEYAATHGKLISVKARLEVKAINPQTGEIIATDRQTTVAVDLTEQIAAKTALQQAGALLAERLLVKLVK